VRQFPLEVTPPTTLPTNLSTDSPDLPVDISNPPNVGNESEGSSTSEEPTSRYPTGLGDLLNDSSGVEWN